jgi:uncharacterized protein
MIERIGMMERVSKGMHILAKPIGSLCNLNCEYCFYTEKASLYKDTQNFRMPDQVLEAFIRKYVQAQPSPEVPFVWQGGEPTLLGIGFFQHAVELQRKYAGGKRIVNSLQTNGTLLDEAWCEFLKQNDFLVGLSLDGPAHIHDRYRVARDGKPTFDKVMRGLERLKQYRIPFNVLSCVTRESAYKPAEVYRFFKNNGIDFMQFIPIVERTPDVQAVELGLRHATPASLRSETSQAQPASWAVEPEAYGDFLIGIFDEWVRSDVGSVHVMNFEWALASWMGLDSTICAFSEECGGSLVIEHDGEIFSCDHYVYPEYRLGNILTSDPNELIASGKQCFFGRDKSTSLPQYCQNCPAKFACHGECPKHRFLKTPDGERGLNYLCAGYKKYFRHIHPYMKVMRQLIENNLPASKVMDAVKGPLVIMPKR